MYDVVKIIWDDSMSDSLKWRTVEDALDWNEEAVSIIYSVGYLLFEDDGYYVLTLSYHPSVEDAGHTDTNVHGLLRIPKCSVKEIVVLENSRRGD
jgi:hypothetical protein